MTSQSTSGKPARKRKPQKPPAQKNQKVSKTDKLLKLLRQTNGATLQELREASGWQPHSVRGFLSGTVRKKMGLNLISERDHEAMRRYKIGTGEGTLK